MIKSEVVRSRPRLAEDLAPRIRELRFTVHLLLQTPLAVLGFAIIALMVFTAVFAPWIAPYGAEERFWQANLQPPSWEHPFGTDEIGGDILSRVIWATRIDLSLAVAVVFSVEVIAVIVGSISGYFGGRVDEALMRITDMLLAFPGLILAMAVAAALGRNLTNLAIALVVVGWPGDARLVRGVVLGERTKLYVEAARVAGAKSARIIFRHVLPNSIYPLLVSATLGLGGTLLGFAGLSFLGFGAGSGAAEWGYMISLGRNYLYSSPWVATFPGLAIFVTVMGFNLVGDGLRDVLDPRLRR